MPWPHCVPDQGGVSGEFLFSVDNQEISANLVHPFQLQGLYFEGFLKQNFDEGKRLLWLK
jgi:hypothetical protein